MEFVADFHVHSYLSRATAKNLNLEHLNLWSQLKGITVVATGDFTHPKWFSELSERLEPAEDGLFRLKEDYAAETAPMVPASCRGPVRFILSVEISSIYKKDGKTRKVHNVILAPSLEVAEKISERLGRIGNIASDGRPILGLDSKTLLEIVLETSEHAVLIPAHIWTPWFSVLGSKSGFDCLEECFEDLTPQIFAVETGLSSDPAMNWRVSSLDRFTLVSNSDAHSPPNLGREANLFDTDLSYYAIRDALRTGDPRCFLGTLEYFAEEGKYHFDGHRKCGARLSPVETQKNKGLCPVCGRPVTVGVMYRVEELADRKAGVRPKRAHPYKSLLPLTDVLSEVLQVGPKSKKVNRAYRVLVEQVGSEFEILRNAPLDILDRYGPVLFAEAIKRMRHKQVQIAPGYDGEFGTICLFSDEERQGLIGQKTLFKIPAKVRKKSQAQCIQPSLFEQERPLVSRNNAQPGHRSDELLEKPVTAHQRIFCDLNKAQQEAVRHVGGPLLIEAGPGTGKTRTLTHRIAYLLSKGTARPEQILAVTFTNKAAQEMAERLGKIIDDSKALGIVTIKTFHSFCLDIIRLEAKAPETRQGISILNETDRRDVVKTAIKQAGGNLCARKEDTGKILGYISLVKQLLLSPEDDIAGRVPGLVAAIPSIHFAVIYEAYQQLLSKNHLFDFDDLIFKAVRLFEANEAVRRRYQQRFSFISVDEYQDINFAQYRLIRLLARPTHDICVIGDANQAIYGFRGADVRYFQEFCKDYPGTKRICLNQNYRSVETILQASGQVIVDERGNKGGEGIWSGIHGAKVLTIAQLPTEKAEAEYIVKTIEEEVGGISHFSVDSGRVGSTENRKDRSFSDFAVLYRVKEQSKALKEAFARSGIPFQVLGDERLENRKGIREIICYLKAGLCLASDFDVERIVNFPPRRIGRGTVTALKTWSEKAGRSFVTALDHIDEITGLNSGARSRLKVFSQDLRKLKEEIKGKDVHEQIELILDQMKIPDEMSDNKTFEENLATLLTISRSFAERGIEFLARLALEKDQDMYDPRAERVALMTMHASKGLEFSVLFISGCEDGLIPYRRNNDDELDLAEEKRLFYVALTRAQEKVFLTHANKRRRFGKKTTHHISPFLEAIEQNLKQYKRPLLKKPAPKKEERQLKLFEL